MKQCSKCKQWKNVDEFSKQKSTKDGFANHCKICKKDYNKSYYKKNKNRIDSNNKKYKELNEDYLKILQKNYRYKNKDKIKEQKKEWADKNREYVNSYFREYSSREHRKKKIKELGICYRNSPMSFNSNSKLRKEMELYEEVRESNNGNIMCKCAYCGGWFEPIKQKIKYRVDAANGYSRGEGRLYCSDQCKQNCPVYNQNKWPKGQKPATSREVQPELRQLVFARDNYTCQKCNTHRDNLEVGIHCHHKEGILWEPLQSADMDMCITLCEDCHKEVHQIPGCGYYEMRCA